MVKDSRSGPSLPPEIFKLFLLRYLALSYPVEVQNPTSISNLGNLQTLIILPSSQHLPLDIWRMPQLRHLVSSSVDISEYPREATCVLENPQTLSGVKNLICTRRILQKIPNLKKMAISYKGYERDEDYHLDNLVHLHRLENLTLGMHGSFPFQERYNPAFPTGLQRLTLSGWRFAWKDMKIVGSLPNLQVLKLKDSGFKDGEKWETGEGEFPQLRFLLIEKSQLEEWVTECSHFPSLKCLQLHHCPYLREIPCVIGEIPTLELIEVKGVNKSLVESAKQIQKEQQDDWGNFALKIRCFDF